MQSTGASKAAGDKRQDDFLSDGKIRLLLLFLFLLVRGIELRTSPLLGRPGIHFFVHWRALLDKPQALCSCTSHRTPDPLGAGCCRGAALQQLADTSSSGIFQSVPHPAPPPLHRSLATSQSQVLLRPPVSEAPAWAYLPLLSSTAAAFDCGKLPTDLHGLNFF